MKLTKNDTDIFHRVAVVGMSGAGKSTLIAQLAAEFDLIFIDLENAKDVLVKHPQEYLNRIQYVKIPDSASFPIGAQTLMQLFKNNKANICCAHGKHDCAICKKDNLPVDVVDISNLPASTILVVDSGTQLASSVLAYTCKDKPVEYKPERDDWGGLRKYSEFFASQFQAYPGNLIVTFHPIEAEMEDGRTKLVPSFGSKDMSSKVAKAFSDVVYCDVKNKQHTAFSSSTASNSTLTKSRSDFDISQEVVPSLIPLFKNSHLKEPKQAVSAVSAVSANAGANVTPAQQAINNLSQFSFGKKP